MTIAPTRCALARADLREARLDDVVTRIAGHGGVGVSLARARGAVLEAA